ncbi:MAG: hypothetical protein ACWA5A_01295 [Marinibacterium sp.]
MPVGRTFSGALMLVLLASCALDRETAVRAELARWAWPGDTLEFTSRATCTAGVFQMALPDLRRNTPLADSVPQGVAQIRAGGVGAFAVPGVSPTEISEAVMEQDLSLGIGLLSNGVGPANRCLSDARGPAYHAALTAPGAVMIYDTRGNALIIFHIAAELAFFMRGNI